MLKILQTRLQQYVNQEIPDIQAGFRKGRGTRDQIANIHWIIEKARKFQKNIYFCFFDYAEAFVCITTVQNSSKDGNMRPPYMPPEKSVGIGHVAQNRHKLIWHGFINAYPLIQ